MHPFWYGIAAYGLAEAYERFLSPETKIKWHNFIKSHHGEWGLACLAYGAATGSPSIAAAGVGLALHDRKDANKWFRK